jgi:hypothetical protein
MLLVLRFVLWVHRQHAAAAMDASLVGTIFVSFSWLVDAVREMRAARANHNSRTGAILVPL